MNGLIPAFVAYFAWGIGDTTGAVISRRLNSWSLAFWCFALRLAFYTLAGPFFFAQLRGITLQSAAVAILVGCSSAFGYVTFYRATSLMNPTVAGAIAGSWGASSLLYSLFFLREIPTAWQSLALIVIFGGIVLSIADIARHQADMGSHAIKGLLYALCTMLLWGICGSFIKFPIAQIGWFWSTYALVIPFFLFTFWKFAVRKTRPQNPITHGSGLLIIIYALLTVVAESSYNIGLSAGQISLVAPIAGSNSSLYAILSYLFFRERMPFIQIAGVILTVSGIVVLAFLPA